MSLMGKKHYPLTKRFTLSLSEKAYDKLHSLDEKYGYGNNCLLTVLLENLDVIADNKALEQAFKAFKHEYGAPPPGRMKGAHD